MGISYEEALKAQTEIEDQLLEDPNVVSVGVVAEKDELGKNTGDYVVQVGVMSVEAYQSAKKHGHSTIPAEHIIYSNKGAKEKHVRINVIREGKIEALSRHSFEIKPPSAIDTISDSETLLGDFTQRRRPSPCGQSIGHLNVTAGTIGLVLGYAEGPNKGKAYVLSNNHVLAFNNLGFVGDPIIQPAKHDSGIPGQDTIAHLHRWVPLNFNGNNYVDAAIAEVIGGNDWSTYVLPFISRIGIPNEVIEPQIGMSVEKTGRTTGYTQGEIDSVKYTVKITYPMGLLKFKEQIRTTSMSKPGDSGSCLVEQSSKRPVGLLFAGSETASFFNPLSLVLLSLSEEHENKYPNHTSCFFGRDYPLRILKRSYATVTDATRRDISAERNGMSQFKFISAFPVENDRLMLKRFGFWPQTGSVSVAKPISFVPALIRYFRK